MKDQKVSFTTKSGQEVMVNKNRDNMQAARKAGWKETCRVKGQEDKSSTTTEN